MGRKKSLLSKNEREKIRKEKIKNEEKFNKPLRVWIKRKYPKIFFEYSKVFREVSKMNPHVKDITQTMDWRMNLFNDGTIDLTSLNNSIDEINDIMSIEDQIQEEILHLERDLNDLNGETNKPAMKIEAEPTQSEVNKPAAEIEAVLTQNEMMIDQDNNKDLSFDKLAFISALPDLPEEDARQTQTNAADPFEDIRKYITDFDFEVELLDFECFGDDANFENDVMAF